MANSRSDGARARGRPVRNMRPVPRTSSCSRACGSALRSEEPLDLLAMVSGMLEVTDPRSRDPFAGDEQRLSLADLVESFVGTPYAETTAALTAIRALRPRRGDGGPDRPRAARPGGIRCRTG